MGRAQRWALAATGMLTVTILQVAVALLIVGFSHHIAPLMPPLSVRGATVVYRPFPYPYALIPLALTPLGFALVVWLRKRTVLLAMVLAPPVVIVILPLQKFGLLTPAVWTAVPALVLAVSLWAVRHHCLHRDLV